MSKVKRCRVCDIILDKENSYIMQTRLLCKKHYGEMMDRSYRKKQKAYTQTDRGKKAIIRASKVAYLKYPEKWNARALLRYAVKIGSIIKPKKCEICEEVKPLQGHHEDYNNPLVAIWLCSKCHAKIHKSYEK